jgi:dihydroorotase
MFTAHAAIELYAEVFDRAGRLDRLEGFASRYGAEFYGLPPHEQRITLKREPWVAPDAYDFGSGAVVPYRSGEAVAWRLAGEVPA